MKIAVPEALRKADTFTQANVIGNLIQALGFVSVPLTKSMWNKPSDDFSRLVQLTELAKKDFSFFGKALIHELQLLIDQKKLFPIDDAKLKILDQIFSDYSLKIKLRLAGMPDQLANFTGFRKGHLVAQDVSYVDLSFRMGKILQQLRMQGQKMPSLEEMVKRAQKVPITNVEQKALKWIRRSATRRIAPIADALTTRIEGQLLNQEKAVIRRVLREGVKKRTSELNLSRELRETVLAEDIASSRNYERVVRTEMADAYNQGVYFEIAKDYPDPIVYKDVASTACQHCKRIWGQPGKPRYYKLSEVTGNPSNEGRKAKDWVAQIGVIHPNCTEAGLQVKIEISKGEKK